MSEHTLPKEIIIRGKRLSWSARIDRHAVLQDKPYSIYNPPVYKEYEMIGETREIQLKIADCEGLDPDVVVAEIQTFLKECWILDKLSVDRSFYTSIEMHFQWNGKPYKNLLPAEATT